MKKIYLYIKKKRIIRILLVFILIYFLRYMDDVVINIPTYIDTTLFIISIIAVVIYSFVKMKDLLDFNIISLASIFYLVGVAVFSGIVFFGLKILLSLIFMFYAKPPVIYYDCEIVGGGYSRSGVSTDFEFNGRRYSRTTVVNREASKHNKDYVAEVGLEKTLLDSYYIVSFEIKRNEEACKSVIDTFNFPNDIQKMEKIHYICDKNANKWGKFLKLNFDDKNYTLLSYDEKTKILIDKTKHLILCFKSNEANNFDISYNPKDGFTYGIYKIYYLDEDLMPLFSFYEDGIYEYKNDTVNKQTKYSLIQNKKPKAFTELDYTGIVNLSKELFSKKQVLSDSVEISLYYKDPYAWALP